MWMMWTLAALKGFMIIVYWQIYQGDFTKYFSVPVSLSSVFLATFEIANYIMETVLFMAYTYSLRSDMGIGFFE